jgi:hypothetical protein
MRSKKPLCETPLTTIDTLVPRTNATGPLSRPPDKLPDPWLFDSEKLLQELDRCRELVLLIPAPTHETHFAINNALDAIWNLQENLRYLLLLHREGQNRFARYALEHRTPENTNLAEQREQERVDLLRKQGCMRADYETALERQKRERTTRSFHPRKPAREKVRTTATPLNPATCTKCHSHRHRS